VVAKFKPGIWRGHLQLPAAGEHARRVPVIEQTRPPPYVQQFGGGVKYTIDVNAAGTAAQATGAGDQPDAD